MYIAICDDESSCIKTIEEYLIQLDEIYHNLKWKAFTNAKQLLEFYQRNGNKFDILITDIEMGDITGVELANYIRRRDKNIIIFFLTSYTEYAIQCFRSEPMNFWVKPLTYDVIQEDLKRAYNRMAKEQEYISVVENRQSYEVKSSSIVYFERWDRKTIVKTKEHEYHTNKSLSEYQQIIDTNLFVRVNQTYIVNMAYIKKFTDLKITLKGSSMTVPIGRPYFENLKKQLIIYKERRLTSQ